MPKKYSASSYKYVDDDPFPTHLLCICLCVWI